MALGEPRLDSADDIAAVFSRVKERIRIVAQRQRMNLTDADVDELASAFDDIDWLRAHVLELRAQISDEYLRRFNRR